MREVAGCPGTIIFHLSPSQTIIAEPGCQNCGADTFPTTPPLAIRVTDSEAMGGRGAEVGQGHKPQRTLQSPYAREGRPGSRGHAPATRRDRYAHIWQPRTRPRGSPLRQENRIMGASKARVARFASPCATSDPRVPNRLLSLSPLFLLSPPSATNDRFPGFAFGSPSPPPSHPFLRPSPSRLRGREERCVSANSLSLSPACRQPPAAHWAPSYRHPYNQPWPEGRGIRDACPPSRVDALSLP